MRAARSIESGPILTTARRRRPSTCRRMAACAPRQQLRHAERLDHIVVGAALQDRRTFSASLERTDRTMSGTRSTRCAKRSSTSAPSMSRQAEIENDEVRRLERCPVAAHRCRSRRSCTVKPSSSSPARRKRRICTSSVDDENNGIGSSVIGTDLGLAVRRCEWQMDRHRGSLICARALGRELGRHWRRQRPWRSTAQDPSPTCWRRGGVARKNRSPSRTFSSEVSPTRYRGTESTTSRPLRLAASVIGEPMGRIFGRIVDDLHECLLDQDGIDIA